MRQSLSEREQAGDFSASLCFTHRGNGASIQFRMSPRHICGAFPISTLQNTRRWERIDRQNELNEAFFSLLFFFLPIRKCNHEVVPAPISVLQLERSCDRRGALTPDLHLPQKTERKKGGTIKKKKKTGVHTSLNSYFSLYHLFPHVILNNK